MSQQPAKTPVAWSIAGSDSGGGAGIQADLKTFNAFGVHGCSAITAITAQNSLGVTAVELVSEKILKAQLDALLNDFPPAVIKTGMLGSVETCKAVADFLNRLSAPRPLIVCDPVLKSTSGADLLDPAALEVLINDIFPHVDVLTPNLPELAVIIGHEITSIESAADDVLAMGVKSVLIKGGHADSDECRDHWTNGSKSLWLTSPRIETNTTHGTGCILASAIAASLANGQEVSKAIVAAKTFLNQCLKSPAHLGNGSGPMKIEPFKNDPTDRPEAVGEIGDLAIVSGVGDPAPRPAVSFAADPGSPIPATAKQSHLHRLPKIFPAEPVYFITTNTKNRQKILNSPAVHAVLRDEWLNALERHNWSIGSYVIMPDHVHFFCRPTHQANKLSEFMGKWKQWTSKRIKEELNIQGSIWQQEFFDHLIRSSESYSEKWDYVEQNPVRAGFVDNAADWPFSGFIHYK